MRLTLYTDYSLRVLLYLASKPEGSATITEIAEYYKISRNHLVKVVHNLGINEFITTSRGKNGGKGWLIPSIKFCWALWSGKQSPIWIYWNASILRRITA